MRAALLGISAMAVLASCGSLGAIGGVFTGDRATFDGQRFRASLKADRADPAPFRIEVRQAGKSLAGAREAGRYEATKHCIHYYGNSAALWQVGPDSPDAELVFEGDTLVLTGRCDV